MQVKGKKNVHPGLAIPNVEHPAQPETVGLVAGSIGVLEIVLSTIAYAVVKPGFDLLATYLSAIGATSFAVIRLLLARESSWGC